MSSRRAFLQQSAGSLGAFCFTPAFFLSSSPGASRSGAVALGLFFDDPDVGRMRSIFETDTAFASLRYRLESIDRAAIRAFIRDEVRHNDQLFHIVKLSDTAQDMAFYYLLTGDDNAAALSAECIREIMKFNRWDYFLEDGKHVVGIQRASSTLTAVALCADWLGATISEEERSEWLSVMKEKGCEACFRSIYGMRYPDTVMGWTRDESSTYFEHRPWDRPTDLSQRHIILDSTNLKAVPAAALAIGAMAVQLHTGESPDTQRWIEQAAYSLGTFGDFFARDGSYHEGVSYANYTALNILKATSVLKRHDVVDLTDMINWTGYADFAIGMAMPTADDPYEIVNFGDNGNAKSGQAGKPKRTAVSLWIGATFHDPRAQWFGLNLGGDHDEWALIWYDPAVPEQPQADGNHLWHADLDWIVARTGFQAKDLTVAMRSGGPGNHEHADRNSIIVKHFGEQLVVDPYRPPYGFKDPRWMMRTTAGHSAVLIDGEGHQYHDGTEGTNPSDAVARIVRKVQRDDYCSWTSDATAAYQLVNPDLAYITRSVFIVYGLPLVVLFDKAQKQSADSILQARYFGYNHDGRGVIEAEGASFTTHRPQAVLSGVSHSVNGVITSSNHLPIPVEEAQKHPFAEVATVTPGEQISLCTALTMAPNTMNPPQAEIAYSEGTYRIEVPGLSNIITLLVHDTGSIPEFELR